MFTKKRIIQFCFAALIFLSLDLWMFKTLSTNFRSYEELRNFNEIELFAQTAPEDQDLQAYEKWIPSVKSIIAGARAFYFSFDEMQGDFVPSTGSETSFRLWDKYKESTEFRKAMESVYYLEPMKLSGSYKADYSLDPDIHSQETIASQVYFVPVIDENGYQANGAIMILVPNSTATG